MTGHHARPGGFTLVELLIAVTLGAILAGVALPVFLEQTARACRLDVQAALLEDAGYLQHYYASHDAYDGTPPPALPAAQVPRAGPRRYTITLAVPLADPSSFLLTATRIGASASDACGDFTYDSLGQRGLVAGTFAAGRDVASCWR